MGDRSDVTSFPDRPPTLGERIARRLAAFDDHWSSDVVGIVALVALAVGGTWLCLGLS